MPRDLDILPGKFLPCFDVRSRQVIDVLDAFERPIQVGASAQVTHDHINTRIMEVYRQTAWVAYQNAYSMPTCQQLSRQLLADEAGRAQYQDFGMDRWYGPRDDGDWGRVFR